MAVLALVAWGLAMLDAPPAHACVICVPYPTTTHADVLLGSEAVALAREDPARPYHLAVVEVLTGSGGDASTGVFLPSTIRRMLAFNPADAVVLVRRKGATTWEWLSYAKPAYQEMIREILAQARDWTGERGQRRRFAFFAARLNDANAVIREQAYLEVGRAPYDWIKSAAPKVPLERVRAVLSDWRLVEWHSLYILMLGQSDVATDQAYIRHGFETAARHRLTTNLSAWTTAYLETASADSFDRLEALYFANAGRSREELEQVLQALSVLANQDAVATRPRTAALRRRIAGGYAILLEHHPQMAGWVAGDLMRWRRRVLVDELADIRQGPVALEAASALAVDSYLALAPQFAELD